MVDRYKLPFSPKSPSEIIDIGFDISNLMTSDPFETIASAVIEVETETGEALPNTLVLIGSPSIQGRTIVQRISQGVVDNTYLIKVTATLNNGEILQDGNCISIQEKTC